MTKNRPYKKSHWSFWRGSDEEATAGAGIGEGPDEGEDKDDERYSWFYDICALEFTKDSELAESNQTAIAVEAIERARAEVGGAVVMLFVHGWHNNADWDCSNFVSFRRLVRSMSHREAERRSPAPEDKLVGRRVIGIYIGWEGGADDGLLSRIGDATPLNYWRRDKRARSLADGTALRDALADIITATKDPANGPPENSPLILAGHSMGGMILESALAQWVTDAALPNWPQADGSAGATQLTVGGTPMAGPDVVLLINPASGAGDTKLLLKGLAESAWRKTTSNTELGYEPPLIISITSNGDRAIGWGFRAANALKVWPASAGFTPSMHTHHLHALASITIEPAGTIDYGQFWHYVGFDSATLDKPSPTVTLGLPNDENNANSHMAYQLIARNPDLASPMWIFQVPNHLIDDHNDIFNFKATPLFLALAQAAGAVASLNYDWADLFD